jgi:hypothetical protein
MKDQYPLPDRNMVSSLKDFYTPKKVQRLEFKTSIVAKPVETEFFPEVRPKKGWSLSWTWLTSKSKRFGSGMRVKLTLP